MDRLHEAQKIVWPGVFASVEEARAYFRKYLARLTDVRLLEIALPEIYFEPALASSAPSRANEAESALHFMLSRKRKTAALAGTALGYEILGIEDGGHFHSFLCNQLQNEYSRELGITMNAAGLIDRLEDAKKATELTRRDDVGAEPVDWFPFLLVSHPLPG